MAELEPPYQMVEVLVHSRFASTFITTNYYNEGPDPESHTHEVVLPPRAFVTNFTMRSTSGLVIGKVEEAATAASIMEQARLQGKTASTVSSRGSNRFSTEITIEPDDFIELTLTYQEVLERSIGYSRIYVHIPDDQAMPNFDLVVGLGERDLITDIIIPKPTPGINERTTDQILSDISREYTDPEYLENLVMDDGDEERQDFGDVNIEPPPFGPIYDPQPGEYGDSKFITWTGITDRYEANDLVILYDTEMSSSRNQEVIQTVDGFFVHFLTPNEEQLQTGDKNIVFVLDRSGSMKGKKWEQVQSAMENILYELADAQYNENDNGEALGGDKFSIVMFSTDNMLYKNGELQNANDPTAIDDAIMWVKEQKPRGWTNISGGIKKGIEILQSDPRNVVASGIIFLTDGLPTRGTTEKNALVDEILTANQNTDYHIHTLAFGADADYETLQSISKDNRGVARYIYADSDADIQLQGFFKEVAQPMMTDIEITYKARDVDPESLVINGDSMQQPNFDVPRDSRGRQQAVFSDATINNGTQMIIVGRTKPNPTRRPSRGRSSRFRNSKVFSKFSRRGQSAAPQASPTFRPLKGTVTGNIINQQRQEQRFSDSVTCDASCKKNADCKIFVNPDRVLKMASLFKARKNIGVPINSYIAMGEYCPMSQWSDEARTVAQDLMRRHSRQTETNSNARERLLPANTVSGFVQRFWAFQTVNRLIEEPADTAAETQANQAKAIEMSKKYNFVNELTSMVAVEAGIGFNGGNNDQEQLDKDKVSSGGFVCEYNACFVLNSQMFNLADQWDAADAMEIVKRALKKLDGETQVCILQYGPGGLQQVQPFKSIAATEASSLYGARPAPVGALPSDIRLGVIFDSATGGNVGQIMAANQAFSAERSVGLYVKRGRREQINAMPQFFAQVRDANREGQAKDAFDLDC